MVDLNKHKLKKFEIQLINGTRFCLSADAGLAEWLNRMAEIMELPGCDADPEITMIFKTLKQDKPPEISEPKQGRYTDSDWSLIYSTFRLHNRNKTRFICETDNCSDIPTEYLNMWYSLLPIYYISTQRGGLPFHAGLAEFEGKGVLLAGPGGTGKTTCCSRLSGKWKALCDDETLAIPDIHSVYQAHPFPTWSDYLWGISNKTWNTRYAVPISAVFFLEQAETDRVIPIGEGEASMLIKESSEQLFEKYLRHKPDTIIRGFRKNLFDNACYLTKRIPTYRLMVSLNGCFWEKIEQVL